MTQDDPKKASPTRTMAPAKAVKFALEELNPAEDPDDFADLIDAAIRCDLPMMGMKRVLGDRFHCDEKAVIGWATGTIMPTPRTRRAAVAFVREHLKTCKVA